MGIWPLICQRCSGQKDVASLALFFLNTFSGSDYFITFPATLNFMPDIIMFDRELRSYIIGSGMAGQSWYGISE